MLPVTIGSTACYLLDCEEAWLKSPVGEFAVRSATGAGLSQREHRSAFAATTILTLSWRIYVEGDEARRWRAALRSYRNEPVLAPFWPAACLLEDLPGCKWTGGLRLFFEPSEPGEGITTYQVLAGASVPTSFTPSADCMVVPLAWSRFDSLPQPEAADGDEAMEIELKTVENGPANYAIAPLGVDLPAGPTIGGLTPRLLDIVADWGASVSAGGIDLRIDRERIGYGRAEAEEYVDQVARRRQKVTLPPVGDEIPKLVALFAAVGNVASFWVPGCFADARLAIDSSAVSAGITVDDARYLASQHYVALVDDDSIAPRKITSRDGVALTLQSSPGAFAAGTAVCPLLLVRFASSKLKITWTTPTVATASVEVVELPTETDVPAGEQVGTTIGDLSTPVWLYHVTDGDLTWRYTSFESAITAGALGTFEPRPIDHGDITSEINLQRHDVDLTVGWFAGSPFERARLDRLAPALTVQIYEGTLAAPAAAELIFTGKAAGYQFVGKKCTCKIAGPTALFDVRGPVAVTSPRCWTPMYSSLCGLSREALSVAADLVGIDADGTLRFVATGASGWPAVVRDHYRFGYAVRTLADGSRRTYAITGSSATGDGSVAPNPWSVGYRTSAAGAALNPFTEHLTQGTLDIYRLNVAGYVLVERNNSAAPVNVGGLLPGGAVNTHGYAPYIPVVRFTAPAAGVQTVAISTYNTASSIGHTVTASIVRNGVVVYERYVSLGNELSFVADLSLAAGETIDVAISTGSDSTYDGTGLNFRVGAYSFAEDWLNPISTDAELKVTVLRAPTSAELPESGWVLCPGCDGSWGRCGQLGNKANFRGCPHFPKTNPAMVSVKQETSSGSKK